MTHPIFVCLKHKLIMHTCRNAGIHCKFHHNGKYYSKVEREGILIEIGVCENIMWSPCKDPHNRQATPEEIQLAQSMIKSQLEKLKILDEEIEETIERYKVKRE